MTVRRTLITGSRDWLARQVVWLALATEAQALGEGDALVVVHGDCPTGADRHAKRWVEIAQRREADMDPTRYACTIHEEAYPAEWDVYGKSAGPIRNQYMVDLGADVCLAFPLPQSRGTVHCMARAEKAGIPVKVFEPSGVSS